ncbi:YscQ/HrcQ family type III secretion apparatus protein [Trinickia dabaoshanensis]|uniref:YscQ/HrcQ family type III secretion apparatus protein n=1 Tax=Trinickia dabaoshanensis TaxID=564714 RepID=A0A2N7VTF4_9BURK|nr:type III secretion system cytoplasmic ring protein SctQ [Trinickia dabaoshanensis]PMS20424.1 YscQ/HrcQ family type III secretion apparatus protein [Trinickia dabaoshanensis]
MTEHHEPGVASVTRSGGKPVPLRRVDAFGHARHRLALAHHARCLLADGATAQLVISEGFNDTEPGLRLSTRFGPVMAYGYGPMLLACTGVDIEHAESPPAQTALARFAFAALPPAIRTALGDPTVGHAQAPKLASEPTLALALQLRLPSIRLSMGLEMTASGLLALLDSAPWAPVAVAVEAPAWTLSLDALISLRVGDSILPLAAFEGLARGDVVRLTASAFDVAGRATLPVASHRLRLRWLDSHHCFEVEDMTHAPPPAHEEAREAAADASAPFSSIDPAAVPIRLSFLLGTLRLTVGELAAVRPGSLLRLRERVPPEVVVEANGQPIGSGELVELDGRLAVEITRWPHPRPPAETP